MSKKPVDKLNQTQLTLRGLLAKIDNLNELQMDPELNLIELYDSSCHVYVTFVQ